MVGGKRRRRKKKKGKRYASSFLPFFFSFFCLYILPNQPTNQTDSSRPLLSSSLSHPSPPPLGADSVSPSVLSLSPSLSPLLPTRSCFDSFPIPSFPHPSLPPSLALSRLPLPLVTSFCPQRRHTGSARLVSWQRSRSLTELTRQIAPPTKNGHAPPPLESRKSYQSVNPR